MNAKQVSEALAIILTVAPDARFEFADGECFIVVGICSGLDEAPEVIIARRWSGEQIARLETLGWTPALDDRTSCVCFTVES